VRLAITQIRKSYGAAPALDVAALDVAEGEFFSLLGPSGCGKTTALRCIAGTTAPDCGRIVIGDRDVTGLPAHRRNVGMVFQHYALFPHLTVRENVAYGLEGRGLSAAARDRRLRESLDLVALDGFDARYPHQLSGGQQQRVAVARAIAYRPDVLLLDEPFSNLDVKLRGALRTDLKRLQQTLRLTTIFVTHDQQEALGLSDRIAVMHDGRVEQVGTPQEIYDRPSTLFVADFVGGTNLVRATIEAGSGDAVQARIDDGGAIALPGVRGVSAGSRIIVLIKPERVRLAASAADHEELMGELASASYLGSGYSYVVLVGGQRIEARQSRPVVVADRLAAPGDRLAVHFDAGAIQVTPS
jgi:putative spermidine/putrescine transport system ATP-binding protein